MREMTAPSIRTIVRTAVAMLLMAKIMDDDDAGNHESSTDSTDANGDRTRVMTTPMERKMKRDQDHQYTFAVIIPSMPGMR